jgi:hypothetical protein
MIDKERWERLSFSQQMGNIASELARAIRFEKGDDIKHLEAAQWRLLELVDLTIEDKKNISRLREICRFKEILGNWYCKANEYLVDPAALKQYSMVLARPATA